MYQSLSIKSKKMERMTRRMKMKTVESLACLVKSVENQFTTIDLQNETSVYGFIKEVDWYLWFSCIGIDLLFENV